MTRCVIYARVSTPRQAEQNISIPDQTQRCVEYAERRDLQVVSEFVELGVSGRDDRRPMKGSDSPVKGTGRVARSVTCWRST